MKMEKLTFNKLTHTVVHLVATSGSEKLRVIGNRPALCGLAPDAGYTVDFTGRLPVCPDCVRRSREAA